MSTGDSEYRGTRYTLSTYGGDLFGPLRLAGDRDRDLERDLERDDLDLLLDLREQQKHGRFLLLCFNVFNYFLYTPIFTLRPQLFFSRFGPALFQLKPGFSPGSIQF